MGGWLPGFTLVLEKTRTRDEDDDEPKLGAFPTTLCGRLLGRALGENSLVFLDGVAVSHAGKIITDSTMDSEFADAFAGVFANVRWMLHVMGEEVAQELFRAEVGFVDDGVEV